MERVMSSGQRARINTCCYGQNIASAVDVGRACEQGMALATQTILEKAEPRSVFRSPQNRSNLSATT